MLDDDPAFRQNIIEKIETDSIDWQKFVTLCSNHLILPTIYQKFQSHDIIQYLPEELSEFLKEIYDLNFARNTQILEQLHEITDVLNNSNIYPLFLKGAGNLLDDLYSNIGERMLADIDFLVHEKDYLLSAKLLENEGYSIANPYYGDIGKMLHYPSLLKPGAPAHIEIHRQLSDKCQSWFIPGLVEKEKKPVNSLKGCWVLSDKHKIILNFIHSQLTHAGHIYSNVSFRDIYDLYLLSKRVDIKRIINNIKSKRKAITYFAFADKAFGLNGNFFNGSNISFWLFSKKHDLNLSSHIFFYTYRSIIYITHRIFIRYIGLFIKSFSSKILRESIINRLCDRKWYSGHFQSYLNFLLPNKKA